MAGILLDTSVYIHSLRQGDASPFALRRISRGEPAQAQTLWLSAVVMEELYAGARGPLVKKLCVTLERDFERAGRLLVPILSDWSACGQVLSKIAEKYGCEQIWRARMTNDALIATSAGRSGLTVLTKNAVDFQRIAEFRPLKWESI